MLPFPPAVGSRCLASPSPCCLCWCDVPLLAQIPGRLGMAPLLFCLVAALHEPPRTAGSVSAPRALLGLAEPHKKPFASSGCPVPLAAVLCLVWHAVTDTSLCSLCLSAAFTREGMPVSTFLTLIPLPNPFFRVSCHPAGLFCCCKIQTGCGFLGVNIAGLGGICFRKGKEETVGAGLCPSWMECPSFVVKLSRL